jgi:hypothetical protein
VLILVIITTRITIAQTTATGWVKDAKGNPLRFAFVADPQYKNGAYSDTTGYFSIAVHPDSKLDFQLRGYNETSMAVDKSGADIQVVLTAVPGSGSESGPGGSSNLSTSESLTRNEMAVVSTSAGGYLSPAHEKGDTRGYQYLFKTFEHGYMINSEGNLVQNPDYLLDYDKLNGTLLLTKDNKHMNEVDWLQTQAFVIFSDAGVRFEFEKAPLVDKTHYLQVLSSGKKYKIYKFIKTKFVKSDFVNNGVTQHGHDYDEYVDDADYFVLDVQSNQVQPLTLKKKSIKADFAKDADKVSKFFSDNSGDIDDAYLSKLGAYMNQ